MDNTRLQVLLEAYGADARRWPEADRPLAQAAFEESDLSPVLDNARTTDDLLGLSPAPVASAALRERVLAAAPKARARVWAPGAWLWRGALGAGMAAAVAAGVMVGWSAPPAPAMDDDVQLALVAYAAPAADTAFGGYEGVLG